MLSEGGDMRNEKKNNKAQLQNKQEEQKPSELNEQQNSPSAQKGMNREAEEELLTTGGPVDRSAVEDDRGSIDAQTGGMSMHDEEANPSKDDFVRGKVKKERKGRSARYGTPEEGIRPTAHNDEDIDTSQDKTEGITNPRTTLNDWKKFKNYGNASGEEDSPGDDTKKRGKNNNDDTGKEFNDIAPV